MQPGVNGSETTTEYISMNLIVGIISLVLLVYLLVAMIWPEKF